MVCANFGSGFGLNCLAGQEAVHAGGNLSFCVGVGVSLSFPSAAREVDHYRSLCLPDGESVTDYGCCEFSLSLRGRGLGVGRVGRDRSTGALLDDGRLPLPAFLGSRVLSCFCVDSNFETRVANRGVGIPHPFPPRSNLPPAGGGVNIATHPNPKKQVDARVKTPIRLDPVRPEYHRAVVSWNSIAGRFDAASTGGQMSSR